MNARKSYNYKISGTISNNICLFISRGAKFIGINQRSRDVSLTHREGSNGESEDTNENEDQS